MPASVSPQVSGDPDQAPSLFSFLPLTLGVKWGCMLLCLRSGNRKILNKCWHRIFPFWCFSASSFHRVWGSDGWPDGGSTGLGSVLLWSYWDDLAPSFRLCRYGYLLLCSWTLHLCWNSRATNRHSTSCDTQWLPWHLFWSYVLRLPPMGPRLHAWHVLTINTFRLLLAA